jgi:general secretion pathway protein K
MTHVKAHAGRSAQHGAAILTAMLTVVLVASLAASTLWLQWRGIEVEAAERNRTQAAWVLTGALDWARLILREDARKGGADHLAEPWAVPLEQARLSTFLAADRDASSEDVTADAFLSGQIVDLQSRLNVRNLVQGGKLNEPSRAAFARLFELLDLPEPELELLVDNLRLSQIQDSTADNPSRRSLPLAPQEFDQLTWVGLSAPTLARLRPYVTLLPALTPVNLNTAPVEVVYACVAAFDMADATRLVRARSLSHLSSIEDAAKASGNLAAKFDSAQHSVMTRFFEVRGTLQLDQTTVQEQSVVQRDPGDAMKVTTWSRRRSAALPGAPLQ